MAPLAPLDSLDGLIEALRRAADRPELEVGVGQLEHGLQCGAILRREHPADLELAVAGLVHDLASSLEQGPRDHGVAGAALVRGLLGDRVADLVRLHVPAKRYLVSTDPGYRSALSSGSITTLGLQGEAMSPDEIVAFESEPEFRSALTLRRADDRAKQPDCPVPGLDSWRVVLASLVER